MGGEPHLPPARYAAEMPKPTPTKSARKAPPSRIPADLPLEADDLTAITRAELLAGERLEDCCANGLDIAVESLPELSLSGSILEGVSFANVTIGRLRCKDVRFSHCDFSNAVLRGFEARRVEFIDCRLLGAKAAECDWHDVLVERCDASYLQLNGGKVLTCEFRSSRLDEADLRGADVTESVFVDSSLRRAELTGARLKDTDLRGADIEAITVGAEDVRGAIVTAAQAMQLARLLGVVIR